MGLGHVKNRVALKLWEGDVVLNLMRSLKSFHAIWGENIERRVCGHLF